MGAIQPGQPPTAPRRVLARIGGNQYAEEEIKGIQQTLAAEEIQKVHFGELLEPGLLKILLTGVILAVLQQWSGINVIFNYAEEVFHLAGYDVSSILFNIVITGVVMLLFTIIAMQTVDRFGRRALMLIGCAGIAIFHVLIGCSYYLHWSGPLVVTFVLATIACFLLTYTFPLLNGFLGAAGTFWLYAAICMAGFVFILLRVPETKGKTLEAIETELMGNMQHGRN